MRFGTAVNWRCSYERRGRCVKKPCSMAIVGIAERDEFDQLASGDVEHKILRKERFSSDKLFVSAPSAVR